MYLGAKHMVTGYDHLLFLFGVIFFLYRLSHIGIYVSLFAIGHSTTLLLGVIFDTNVSSYLIDAIIGLSEPCMGTYLSRVSCTYLIIAPSRSRQASSTHAEAWVELA